MNPPTVKNSDNPSKYFSVLMFKKWNNQWREVSVKPLLGFTCLNSLGAHDLEILGSNWDFRASLKSSYRDHIAYRGNESPSLYNSDRKILSGRTDCKKVRICCVYAVLTIFIFAGQSR